MKKLLTVLCAVVMAVGCALGLTACGDNGPKARMAKVNDQFVMEFAELIPDDFKIGFIFLHDEKSTYDLNFMNAAVEACSSFGLKESQYILKTNVNEDQACYDAAKELVNEGCKAIFADSFGHETFMIKAAKDFTNVQFYHATGTKAHTEELSNYHNAFANIYEGRYLAGVVAGLKLEEMIKEGKITTKEQAKVGYVGAFPYAEVISGYTSWFLGVRSVVPEATMEVQFTGSWYDEVGEKTAAENLISRGCVLISQHADSMGAPSACEKAGVPNVSYNGSTALKCPKTFLISSKIDWSLYFKMIISTFAVTNDAQVQQHIDDLKAEIGYDFTAGLFSAYGEPGAVKISEINMDVMAKGTIGKVVQIVYDMLDNSSKYIFDCSKFTVKEHKPANATIDEDGHLISYLADVNDFGDYKGETEVVLNDGDGYYFAESFFRSAPYFDIQIDGITLLNVN